MVQYRGVSSFAITNKFFPYKRHLRQFHEDTEYPIIPVLPGTFGWATIGLKTWNEKFKDRSRIIEIHFSNGAGRRNKKLQRYELWHPYSVDELNQKLRVNNSKVKHELIEWTHQINAFLSTVIAENEEMLKILVCPELEDNMTDIAWERAKSIIKNNINYKVRFVRNKLQCCGTGGKFSEAHGQSFYYDDRFIYNLDGLSVDFTGKENFHNKISVEKFKTWVKKRNKSYGVISWSATQQGLAGRQLPPRKRFRNKKPNRIILRKAIKVNRDFTKGNF